MEIAIQSSGSQASREQVQQQHSTVDASGLVIGGFTAAEARFGTNDDSSVAGVMSTARNSSGRALAASEVTPKSRVVIGGQEMTVQTAERLGFLSVGQSGLYQDVTQAPESAQEPQENPSGTQGATGEPETAPELDSASGAILANAGAMVGGTDLRAALHDVTEDGELSSATAHQLAMQMQLEPEELAKQFATVRAGFEAQAAAVVEGMGLDAREVMAYAQQHAKADLKAAIREAVDAGSAKGYERIAVKALGHMIDHAARSGSKTELVADAQDGITVERRNGKVVVRAADFGEVELKTAVRMGLVTVRTK